MYEFLPDIILILISVLTCLYCWLLSRRLKKLQSLEGGLGASILELTRTITETNKAALAAKRSTEASVETLESLLLQVDTAIPQIEARLESLKNARALAKDQAEQLETIVQTKIEPTLKNATCASRSLLQIVSAVKAVERRAAKMHSHKPDAISTQTAMPLRAKTARRTAQVKTELAKAGQAA